MFHFLGHYSSPYFFCVLFALGRSIIPMFIFGLFYWTSFYVVQVNSWATIRAHFLNVPCSLLSGSMPWLFSPTSASPLGFVRSSLFLFYTSYLLIYLLIIILYRKIYVITVIKGVQNGILNGKREKNQED